MTEAAFNTFLAGELSPKHKGRLDLPQYQQGCATVENAIIEPSGGSSRRPGFEHIASAHSHSYASRLVPFVKGSDRYMLEFNQSQMRAFKSGALVAGSTTATPWTSAQRRDLVFAPRGQAIFHPSFDPRELVCNSDTSWTLTAFASRYGPFLDANKDETLTLAPSATSGTGKTLTASSALFDADHVGALFELTQPVNEVSLVGQFDNSTSPAFTQNATSSPVTIKGRYDVAIQWKGWGTLKLQRSDDGGSTWKTVKTWDTPVDDKTAVFTDAGEEVEDDIQYRFYIDWAAFGDPDGLYDNSLIKWIQWGLVPPFCQYSIKAKNTTQVGVCRVTAVNSATQAVVSILNTFGSTSATAVWREGAWSTYRGYPACGTIHESRVYAASTDYQPTAVWAGRPFLRRADARVFYDGTDVTADDAFTRIVDIKDCNVIRWLEGLWVMLAGADGNIIKGVGPTQDSPMTPVNATFVKQSGMGSHTTQPIDVAGATAYAGRDGKSVYELEYTDDKKVYEPEPLTELQEHILGSGIVEWAFQQQPYPILWCVTGDGELVGLTRRRATRTRPEVLAWHRHPVGGDGLVESVGILPGDTEDEVWISVARTINGSTYRSIERMKPFGTYSDGDSQRDCFYVDGGTMWDGGAAVDITDISVDPTTHRVTVTASGMTDAWTVRIAEVVGMTDVNGHVYTVADATATEFTLKTRDGSAYINGSAFGAYTSGGTVERVANSVSSLAHLAACQNCAVLLDGQPATGTVTSAGVYTVGTGKDRYYANTIIIGHDVEWTLEPMPYYSASPKHRITNVDLFLYLSAGGKLGSSADNAQDIDYQGVGRIVGADVALVSGMKSVPPSGAWGDEATVYLTGNGPLPFSIAAVKYTME